MATTRLECTTNNHYKFYEVTTTLEGDSWIVSTRYGRIGNTGTYKTIGTYRTQGSAEWKSAEIVSSKRAKGYVVTSTSNNAKKAEKKQENPVPSKETSPTEFSRFESLLDDD